MPDAQINIFENDPDVVASELRRLDAGLYERQVGAVKLRRNSPLAHADAGQDQEFFFGVDDSYNPLLR